MKISGLKDLVQTAYENKKFLTNGQTLPNIDFNEPLLYEVTAINKLGYISVIKLEDDTVVESDHAFTRTHYLQMSNDCIFQSTILGLLEQCPETAVFLQDVLKPRISITGFTAKGKKPYRVPPHVEDSHRNGILVHRKLQQEKHYFIRYDEELLSA